MKYISFKYFIKFQVHVSVLLWAWFESLLRLYNIIPSSSVLMYKRTRSIVCTQSLLVYRKQNDTENNQFNLIPLKVTSLWRFFDLGTNTKLFKPSRETHRYCYQTTWTAKSIMFTTAITAVKKSFLSTYKIIKITNYNDIKCRL